MTTFEAVRQGFRIARRYPTLGAIETIWRTAFALLVVLFGALGAGFFLQHVILSNLEIQALRSKIPVVVSLEIQRLLARYGQDLGQMTLFVSISAAFMWLLFASIFRPGILGMMTDAFKRESGVGGVLPSHGTFSSDVRMFFRSVGMVNFTYLFFSVLVLVLSAGIFLGAVWLGTKVGDSLAPLVVIVCLTLGGSLMFLLWTLIDVVTDLAQIAVVFEERRYAASIRRAAEILQTRLGAVIGIGLILFVFRIVLAGVFGVMNLTTNFMFGQLWPSMIWPATLVLLFFQSILMYFLYIVNLASFVCLFEPQNELLSNPIPLSGKIIYEH